MILDITFEENKSEIDVGLDPTTEYASKLLEKVIADNDETEAAIREAAEMVVDAADRVEKVSVDKGTVANALKATASGEVVRVDDVSPIEHTIKAKVFSKNLIDLAKSKYNQCNIVDGVITANVTNSYYVDIVCPYLNDLLQNSDGKILTLSADTTKSEQKITICILYTDASVNQAPLSKSNTTLKLQHNGRTIQSVIVRPFANTSQYGDKSSIVSNLQLEFGNTATEYEPYIDPATVTVTRYGADENDNPQTYTPSNDGTCEIASLSPTMTLITDTPGVTINLEYNQDTNKAMDAVHTDLQELDRVTAELSQKPTIGFSRFNQAYVKGGEVICNDGTTVKTGKYIGVDMKHTIANSEIRFKFTGKKAFESNDKYSLLMILTNSGCSRTRHITHGSIHIGVTPHKAVVEFYWDEPDEKGVYPYGTLMEHEFADADGNPEPLSPDTEYRLFFGTKHTYTKDADGKTITTPTVWFEFPKPNAAGKDVRELNTSLGVNTGAHIFQVPIEEDKDDGDGVINDSSKTPFVNGAKHDGTTYYHANAKRQSVESKGDYDGFKRISANDIFHKFAGRYIIFEHFYVTETTDISGCFVGWKAEAPADLEAYRTAISTGGVGRDVFEENNELICLRHDFKHQGNDGLLTSAPTGQNYVLFSNNVQIDAPLTVSDIKE